MRKGAKKAVSFEQGFGRVFSERIAQRLQEEEAASTRKQREA